MEVADDALENPVHTGMIVEGKLFTLSEIHQVRDIEEEESYLAEGGG